MMNCNYCTGTTDSHDAACPLNLDKIEQSDQYMVAEPHHGFVLHRRYAAQCSRGSYQIGEGREVLVLVSAYSIDDAVQQLGIPQTMGFYPPSKPLYRIKAICPWDPRLHGPWFNGRSGVWEQDEKKIPGQPVTP